MAAHYEDANSIRYLEIDFRGEPALFVEERIDTSTIPLPLMKYEVSYPDYSKRPVNPIVVSKDIAHFFLGTLITPNQIDEVREGDPDSYMVLQPGEVDFYTGKSSTLGEYIERQGLDVEPTSGAYARGIDGIEFAEDSAGVRRYGYHLSTNGLHLMRDGEAEAFEKMLQTDKYAYFVRDDERVMFAVTPGGRILELISENYFAEVGFLDSLEAIITRSGNQRVVFMDDLARSYMPEYAKCYEWQPAEANAAKIAYYDVDFQGTRALHSELTVSPESVPKSLHLYEMDSDPANSGGKYKLSKRADFNFEGTLITERPLDLGEDGCMYLGTRDVILRSDSPITLKEFAHEVGVRIKPPKDRER